MSPIPPFPLALPVREIPLWRLLVALDDAERTLGADSDTVSILTAEIQRRLRGSGRASKKKEAPDV
jgi:hypothetical protein